MATNLIPKFMSFLSTMYTTIGVFALVVDEGPDGLDVDRCAENAAQREDEDRHAALLITWRYAW